MKSKPLNIVIYLPKNIEEISIKSSKEIYKKGGLFYLNKKTNFPHITLYMSQFPIKNIPKIKEVLKKIASKIKTFELEAINYRYNTNTNYVDVEFKKTIQINKLQNLIIKSINPLREGLLRKEDEIRILNPDLNQKIKEIINKKGTSSMGKKYFPHITLSRINKSKSKFSLNENINKLPNIQNFNHKLFKIGLFFQGKHGTCSKKIDLFDLN